jgi:hypothetical protein
VLAGLVTLIVNQDQALQISKSSVYNGFLGWLITVNFVLLFYVLPLYISSKLREKRAYWEIPMAAQTFALFELLLILVSEAISPLAFIIFGFNNQLNLSIGIVVTALIFLLIAIYPIYYL